MEDLGGGGKTNYFNPIIQFLYKSMIFLKLLRKNPANVMYWFNYHVTHMLSTYNLTSFHLIAIPMWHESIGQSYACGPMVDRMRPFWYYTKEKFCIPNYLGFYNIIAVTHLIWSYSG